MTSKPACAGSRYNSAGSRYNSIEPSRFAKYGFSNWCPRPESNRHDPFGSRDFLTASAFAASASAVRGLEHAFTIVSRLQAPAVCSLHLPANLSLRGLARRWLACLRHPGRSPNLTGFTSGVSPGGLKLLQSLVSTDFTTRASLARCRTGVSPATATLAPAAAATSIVSRRKSVVGRVAANAGSQSGNAECIITAP
jgi:hypothetical protein